MRKVMFFTVLLVLVLALAGGVQAQTASGQITGTVRDASGGVVPNAKVTLGNQQTGMARTTRTSETGTYTFPLLPVGLYSVTAEQQGFSNAKHSDIQLNVDQIVRIDLDLAVGSTTETVNVSASAVALDSETSAVGHVITQRQDRKSVV